jgi:hypothetical protein
MPVKIRYTIKSCQVQGTDEFTLRSSVRQRWPKMTAVTPPIKLRRVGSTGLAVSELGLGTAPLANLYEP